MPSGSRLRRQAETRAALIATADEMFTAHGFRRTSLAAVAAASGFTKGAVYASFASKEHLLVAVMEARDADAFRALASIPTAPKATLLSRLAAEWARQLASDRDRALLGLEFRLHALRNPDLAATIADWQRRSHAQVEQLLLSLTERHALRLSCPPSHAAALVLATSSGVAQQLYADDATPAAALLQRILEQIVEPA